MKKRTLYFVTAMFLAVFTFGDSYATDPCVKTTDECYNTIDDDCCTNGDLTCAVVIPPPNS
jgi:hypothetical protein